MLNPYEVGTVSYKIYENNYIDPGEKILSACSLDKFIICMYVVGKPIKDIAETTGYHHNTIRTKLLKYGVNK